MSRRRYRFNTETQQMEEIGQDWTDAPRRAQTATEELVYGGLQATDGTDISSRRKHREYKATRGLADAGDYQGTWEKAKGEREAYRTGESQATRRATREAIQRAWHKLSKP